MKDCNVFVYILFQFIQDETWKKMFNSCFYICNKNKKKKSSCLNVCVKQFTSLNVEFIQNNKTIEKVDVWLCVWVCVCKFPKRIKHNTYKKLCIESSQCNNTLNTLTPLQSINKEQKEGYFFWYWVRNGTFLFTQHFQFHP